MALVPIAEARKGLAALLERVSQGEVVELSRHGKPVVALIPAARRVDVETLERELARVVQGRIEMERLMKHQRVGMSLLAEPESASIRILQARSVVDRWEREHLCSPDFIASWRKLLALPVPELALRMCEDLNGWGPALRQNSPWSHV